MPWLQRPGARSGQGWGGEEGRGQQREEDWTGSVLREGWEKEGREGLRRSHAVTSSCWQLGAAHGACMCPSHGPARCRKPQPPSREDAHGPKQNTHIHTHTLKHARTRWWSCVHVHTGWNTTSRTQASIYVWRLFSTKPSALPSWCFTTSKENAQLIST